MGLLATLRVSFAKKKILKKVNTEDITAHIKNTAILLLVW